MWLHVVARAQGGAVVYESGAWEPSTGLLDPTPAPVVYEAHLGVSPALGGALGLGSGPTFHFTLNDTLYKDNRIPPQGFTNAAFAAFGGQPVDHEHPGLRYVDGQNWDVASYSLPASAHTVRAELLYQTTSKEYVEFLKNENTTNGAGQALYDAWVAHGRSAPVVMGADSVINTLDVPEPIAGTGLSFGVARNPFRGALEVVLSLDRPARVTFEVYDVGGRRIASQEHAVLSAGPQRLTWDGQSQRGGDAGAGVFWLRLCADDRQLVRQVVRLR
jgi:hypothetical protein